MKKIVIVGAGTAGLAAAAMMKNYWGDKVDISLYYDASKGNFTEGERTPPIILLLFGQLEVNTKVIKEGESYARTKITCIDMHESCKIILKALEKIT